MRREELFLHDIIDAADAIQRFVNDTDEEEFSSNEMRRSAVLQKLLIIGEAAAGSQIHSLVNIRLSPGLTWWDFATFSFMNTFRLTGPLYGRLPPRMSHSFEFMLLEFSLQKETIKSSSHSSIMLKH